MNLTLFYRGLRASCTTGCDVCPVARNGETPTEYAHNQQALERFVAWVNEQHNHTLSIFFTFWGEMLSHHPYQQAIIALTQMPHVAKVAVQTSLADSLDWIDACNKTCLGICAIYRPGQMNRSRFLARCKELDQRGVSFSVGVAGIHEHMHEITILRCALPARIYLWVNAYKHAPGYYSADDIERLTSIDPLFPINNHYHPSRGRTCYCGESVVAVDGDGTLRRCYFIAEPIGNIYLPGWEQMLRPRLCTNATCGCHIGYIHMPHLGIYELFGDGLLERVPGKRR